METWYGQLFTYLFIYLHLTSNSKLRSPRNVEWTRMIKFEHSVNIGSFKLNSQCSPVNLCKRIGFIMQMPPTFPVL